jgi:peptidoglycan/LPS O-acetylase OafA/YrhL
VGLVETLLLLQSFGVEQDLLWNTPSWSIAAEFWSYTLFALILACRPKRPAVAAAIFSAAALAWILLRRGSIEINTGLGFERCVYGFGLGLITFHLFRRRPSRAGTFVEIAVLVAIVVFVSLAKGRWTFAAPALFALSVYFLAGGRGLISAILKRPAFQFLGMTSYSIYMIHYFIEQRFIQIFHLLAPALTMRQPEGILIHTNPWLADALTLVVIAIVIGCSWITYSWIEKPGQRITRKWLAQPKAATVAPKSASPQR